MKLRIQHLFIALLGLMISSCKTPAEVPSGNNLVDYVKLDAGNLFGAGEEGFSEGGLVIESQDELSAFVEEANTFNNAVKENLFVDFENEMILVYMDRIRGTLDHELKIKTVHETTDAITMEVIHEAPKEAAAEVITQPFIIISIAKSDKEVRFSITQ